MRIARIDTAHGYGHIDRLYRHGRPNEQRDPDFRTVVEYACDR